MKKRCFKMSTAASSNNYSDSNYVKNETAAYLRQLLFKEKKTTEQLSKALTDLNNSYTLLANSNKLLAESNVNYQAKRAKLQAELHLYKRKNEELLSILMKRKVRLNRSLGQSKADQVLRETKHEPEIQHNDLQMRECLRNMKREIEQATSSLARIATRGFFKRVRNRDNRISFSCPMDYLPKQELDSVEHFIKRQQQKLMKEERERDDTPFLADFSMIKPERQPITFTDYPSRKRKLISDSFIQISEEILRH